MARCNRCFTSSISLFDVALYRLWKSAEDTVRVANEDQVFHLHVHFRSICHIWHISSRIMQA